MTRKSGHWVEQHALDWTDPVDGFSRDAKFLILDRDPVFTKEFKNRLKG